MSKREINIHGAIFEYNGSNNTVERINSTDRIEEELTLQVNIYLFSWIWKLATWSLCSQSYVMLKFTEKQLFYLN